MLHCFQGGEVSWLKVDAELKALGGWRACIDPAGVAG